MKKLSIKILSAGLVFFMSSHFVMAQESGTSVSNITLNTQDLAGNTDLHLVAYQGDSVTVMNFLELGADPNAKNNEGRAPLHFAAYRGHTITAIALI